MGSNEDLGAGAVSAVLGSETDGDGVSGEDAVTDLGAGSAELAVIGLGSGVGSLISRGLFLAGM